MFSKKQKNLSALNTIESVLEMLSKETKKHTDNLTHVSMALKPHWEQNVQTETQNIICINRGRQALESALDSMKDFKQKRISNLNQYQISSIFLLESWKFLTSDPNRAERLHLVTGTITEEGTIVLSRMEQVDMESQSPVYVQAKREDSHKKIVSLSEDFGHLLLGMFHSHTSNGAGSTSPSSIDIQNLKRKEKIGINCLGGIFSLDGYIRFFALRPFEIHVYGKGVSQIKVDECEAIFKIEDKGNFK